MQVEDFLWLGGVGVHGPPPDGDSYAIPFKFGCQVKLSGLFIPQRENGILGLSDGENNLLHHLKTQVSYLFLDINYSTRITEAIIPFLPLGQDQPSHVCPMFLK